MTHSVTDSTAETGFALPTAIFALVVVGVLVTGGFILTTQETRISQSTERGTAALYLAESGIGTVVQDWENARFMALALWETDSVAGSDGQGEWQVEVRRIGNQLFFLSGRGEITHGGAHARARREVGVVARALSLNIDINGALTTRGDVGLVGQAQISGLDVEPPSWGGACDGSLEDTPGVITTPGSEVSTSGGAEVTGDPEYGSPSVDYDDSLDDETFTVFGDLTWDDLVQMANITRGPGTINNTGPNVVDGECVPADWNWGDPENPDAPCGSYFPVIHVSGDVSIQSAGVGQGILLVDGDLSLQGDFIFHGIIIAQGTVSTYGGGPRIYGGVMASNATLENENTYGGSSQIQYSSCSVQRTLMNANNVIRLRPIVQRNWVDLSSLAF